ncbi:type II secretion system protein GspI [Tepidimonas aquatica]|uniref:GspI: type II secretion system protein I n=1 Tax=Tepidimonas aquatica TaxID=247482 RepID=A0A554WW95_9BURK|nr:type II secretion system protein GspI [Tepidimonas aquatica]TSE27846.1 gspI: type II secretion system protein I [Tepidimonas aquatica]
MCRSNPQCRLGGITLVEVLVALTIVATAALAAQHAADALVRTAQREPLQWLAQLCAHNAQVALRLAPTYPPPGQTTTTCTQGGHALAVTVDIDTTPNPSFRRVQVRVREPDSGYALATLTTVLGRH